MLIASRRSQNSLSTTTAPFVVPSLHGDALLSANVSSVAVIHDPRSSSSSTPSGYAPPLTRDRRRLAPYTVSLRMMSDSCVILCCERDQGGSDRRFVRCGCGSTPSCRSSLLGIRRRRRRRRRRGSSIILPPFRAVISVGAEPERMRLGFSCGRLRPLTSRMDRRRRNVATAAAAAGLKVVMVPMSDDRRLSRLGLVVASGLARVAVGFSCHCCRRRRRSQAAKCALRGSFFPSSSTPAAVTMHSRRIVMETARASDIAHPTQLTPRCALGHRESEHFLCLQPSRLEYASSHKYRVTD